MHNLLDDPDDLVYDFSTSCAKDDAVQYLLVGKRCPLRVIQLPENATFEEWELCDLSVELILIEDREAAKIEYSNAKVQKLGDKVIAEKLAALRKCDEAIEQARYYMCCIDHELNKGENSALRIDTHATKNPQFPYITLASLDQWARDKYGIRILEFANADSTARRETTVPSKDKFTTSLQNAVPSGFDLLAPGQYGNHIFETKKTDSKDPLNSDQESVKSPKDEFTVNLLITFALLVKAYVGKANTFHHDDGRLKVSLVAKEIHNQVNNREISLSTIETCIEIGVKTENNSLSEQLPWPKLKSLQITLALLVMAFVAKYEDCRNSDGRPNVIKIVERLEELANGFSDQDEESIAKRINDAMEVRKNPYKR